MNCNLRYLKTPVVVVFTGLPIVAAHVDRSTLTGKVMVGYQGWFNCDNVYGEQRDAIPKQQGEFLWSQVVGATQATGNGVQFLTYDGLPSDFYLTLLSKRGELLRSNRIETETPVEKIKTAELQDKP